MSDNRTFVFFSFAVALTISVIAISIAAYEITAIRVSMEHGYEQEIPSGSSKPIWVKKSDSSVRKPANGGG